MYIPWAVASSCGIWWCILYGKYALAHASMVITIGGLFASLTFGCGCLCLFVFSTHLVYLSLTN